MEGESASVIIPTFNSAEYLPSLIESIQMCGLIQDVQEVIIVNDGSTDDTERVVKQLIQFRPELNTKLKLISLPTNQGRFRARIRGAEQAVSQQILFLDSRIVLTSQFDRAFHQALKIQNPVCGTVEIDVRQNIYCLYWDRTHRLIFKKYYSDLPKGILLTPKNFDQYLKGTGIFLCSRDLFIQVCSSINSTEVLSDDNLLMSKMVETHPITILPQLQANWVPRGSWGSFLLRLWERGPSFIEYHFILRKNRWFWLVCFVLLANMGWFLTCFTHPQIGLQILAIAVAGVIFSATLLSTSIQEWFRLIPLHLAVVAVCDLAIFWGIFSNLWRIATGRFPFSSTEAHHR